MSKYQKSATMAEFMVRYKNYANCASKNNKRK